MKNPRVFYGWWIVGSFFLISAYSFGIIFYGFTALLEPIAGEFNWGYAQISLAASLRDLGTGLLVPFVGFFIDRFGPRRLMFVGIIAVGLGLLLFSRISSLWMLYAVFLIMSISLSTCSGVLPMTVVGNWFRRNVSLATGITVAGAPFGGLFVPLIVQAVGLYGWRLAMAILGMGAWVILLPLAFIVRHKPEQHGYLPDGDKLTGQANVMGTTLAHKPEVDVAVSQALKSRTFCHIVFGMACHILVTTAVATHVIPYLSSIDIPKTTSSLVASAIAVASVLGRLSFGWFGDKHDKRWVTAAGFIMTIVSLLLFCYVGTLGTWVLVPFALLFGIGFGGPLPMISALMVEYFGRARLGTILGIAMCIMLIVGIIGPPLAGWVYDKFASYQGAWLIFIGITVIAIVSLLTTPAARGKRLTSIREIPQV